VTVALLVLAGMVAVADWVAIARHLSRAEYIAKPLTLVLLVAAAGSADLGTAKAWVLAALVLGLFGDVALLFTRGNPELEERDQDPAFLTGLGCFLFGHLAYVVAFTRHGLHPVQLLAGVLVVLGAAVLAMPKVLRGADHEGGRVLAVAVGTYAAALSAMAVLGFGTAAVVTAIGALLFLASDITLAWARFVQPLLRGPLIVAVTYHLAQLLIVIGLLRR
jgi:uncharacterized membrane protein YhhN